MTDRCPWWGQTARIEFVIGKNCIAAGDAFLTKGTTIPGDFIVMGTQGKVVRSKNHFVQTRLNALMDDVNAEAYARGGHRAWSGPDYDVWQENILKAVDAEFCWLYPDEM